MTSEEFLEEHIIRLVHDVRAACDLAGIECEYLHITAIDGLITVWGKDRPGGETVFDATEFPDGTVRHGSIYTAPDGRTYGTGA